MYCQEYITADPNILEGKPIIRSPRLAVEFILGLIAQDGIYVTHEETHSCRLVLCRTELGRR
ncbi:MAG: DUF433 domain-containing protein [Verrucomicrobia bacterium]|nr:DUF433 domain-containing protein [Verrucomicrobiota bacterium]